MTNNYEKHFLIAACMCGALSVALGAFAAHGLQQLLPPKEVQTFETGVRYMFYHTFALLAVGILYRDFGSKWLRWAGNCFLTGIVLFSGSLFLLAAFSNSAQVGISKLGIITPFGGLAFIAGWLLLAYGVWKR
jgi:uncharacterized membrane protein YgdD (TMEM256/DUF423 family)